MSAVKRVLRRLSAKIKIGSLQADLTQAIGSEWDHAAAQLRARLTNLPDTGCKLLITLDELPVLISRMLRVGDRTSDAELLLVRLREWRQAPALRGRVHTLVGGSIGLEGLLRRVGLSALINDLVPFRLDSWERPTAAGFLRELGYDIDFRLDDDSIDRILGLLMDPVPYHVQLFFSELKRLRRDSEQTFMSVLRVLEADGYLRRRDSHLVFRSNLLREWWRKRHGRGNGP